MTIGAARATYDDVNLVIRLYELRRDERLREARRWFAASFKAKTLDEFHALCPIGSEPNRCAYIWLSPQGSKRDGIRVKSLPAKIRRACPSLKPITTPIASGRRRCASTSACSIAGSPLPVTMICPPASMISSAADSTRST